MLEFYVNGVFVVGEGKRVNGRAVPVRFPKVRRVPLGGQRVLRPLQQHQPDRLVRQPARDVERAVVPLPRMRDVHRLEHYSRDLRRAQTPLGLRHQREKAEWVY